ncbi:plasma membrane proteolipid 3 [Cryptococcus sp. DSM 104548]
MAFTCSDIFKIILAVILPPLGVFLERGCNADFLINILLTVLGYIPGKFCLALPVVKAVYLGIRPARWHVSSLHRLWDGLCQPI